MEMKPRIYKDIKFRSTLEASWAIFFDSIGWQWKYEPFKVESDLDSWIPDFVLNGFNGNEIFCEVKPSDSPTEWFETSRYSRALNANKTLVLLGRQPLERGKQHSGSALGWIYKFHKSQIEHAMFFNGKNIGFCDDESSWVCEIYGEYHSQVLNVPWPTIRKYWFDASKLAEDLPMCDAPPFPVNVRRHA